MTEYDQFQRMGETVLSLAIALLWERLKGNLHDLKYIEMFGPQNERDNEIVSFACSFVALCIENQSVSACLDAVGKEQEL